MKRAMYVMAVLVLACGLSARAEEKHGAPNAHHDRDFAGTFEKADGKLVFKSNNESHAVAAGERAADDVKTKLANADKELIGQGTFYVVGSVKKDGDVAVLMISRIIKKGEHGDRKEGGGDHKEGGGDHKDVAGGGGDHKDGGGDHKDGGDDHK